MRKLSENWLTESHIDFELKKYTLLAYLQQVKEQYLHNRLYPALSELIDHYKNLVLIRQQTDKIKEGFPKELTGLDLSKWRLKYEDEKDQEELAVVLEQIIEYSLPLFAENIQEGKIIYDLVEEHLKLQAVGISPIKTNEGYLLLHSDCLKSVHAYRYSVSLFERADERYRGISTTYVSEYTPGISCTYEKIKSDLIVKNKELPNPAVYAVYCDLGVPLQETLLPVAKRYFISRMGF